MSAGVVQLIAIGAQDKFIVGDPQISFFSSTFKRHANFSQSIEKQTIHGAVKNNSMSSVQFERSGDLLSYVYFTMDDNTEALDTQRWDNIVDKVELLIGGSVIDTQDAVFTENIAVDTFAQNVSRSAQGTHPGISARSFFYPLRFFFCEAPQSALPLVALNYHNVELRIYWGSDATNKNIEAFANYIYLDNEERSQVISRKHDMLITQVQKNIPSGTNMQELTFSHPVKFIASSNTTNNSALTSVTNKVKLNINGVDLSNYRWGKPHFIDVTHYYHTNFVVSPDFFLYPFCISTSSHQPTGTLNFSRLTSAKILSESMDILDPIYAVNYNILRVENGLAGLLYAN
jgi:hypothetical protein|tara:strand:- start:7176 stop:8210 length:1035 start_codon:yes stop_codon:yes gene_type:complete